MTDVRTFLEIQPGMKDRLRLAIEALVDVLDSIEPDPDVENNGDEHEPGEDEEPSLGAAHAPDQERAWRGTTCNEIDLEFEGDGVAECDLEPSHGSLGSYSTVRSQTEWARGPYDERGTADEAEDENEHGGDINDEDQPELGSTHAINQEIAWRATGFWAETHPIGEGEPSLGWSNGRGHPESVPFGGNDDREEQHDREHALTDDNGIGDADGLNEQMSI